MNTFSPAHPSFVRLRHGPRHGTPAFSLVEMLVVVALISLMLVLAAPYTMGVIQSATLTTAGDTLMQKVAHAQQRSITENRPIALDFYYYSQDNIKACHAIQLVAYDPATNTTTTLEPPVYWGEGRVVLVDGTLSPMFSTNVAPICTGPVMRQPFQNLSATFYRVIFYPNGNTSLRVPLRASYLTLINAKNYSPTLATAPSDYYTVQIDPVTGRGHAYRP